MAITLWSMEGTYRQAAWAPEEYTEELSAGGEAALYWSKGYQTRAQMKDAKKFTDSFEVSESGYYTVMLGTPNRDAYLIYLYVQ